MNETLDAKTKEKELLGKSNISNPVKNLDLIIRLKTLAAKADLKAEQDKIVKLQTHDWSYFFDKHFFDDGFENRFIYQSTLNTLELKKSKGTEYVIGWKSKVVYTSKLTPLYTHFLHSIKFLDINFLHIK